MSSARRATRVVALALLIASCSTGGVYLGNDVHASHADVSGAPDASSAAGAAGTTSAPGSHQDVDSGDGTSGKPSGSGGRSAAEPPKDAGTRADAGTHTDSDPGTDAGPVTASCADGTDDCDGNPSNGCETELATDAIHCGTCGNVCPAFGVMSFGSSCMSGHCVLVCEAPYADCDGQADTGCETLLLRNDVCP